MSIRILLKCRCVSVVVMLQNGLGNGIVPDTAWFRMLWWHSNTIYRRKMYSACVGSCDVSQSGT